MTKSAKGKIGKADTAGTGWSFTGVSDPTVGFCLEDVEHDDHAFADSIRVERIAVAGFTDNDPHRSRDDLANHHVFGLGECTEVLAPALVELPAGTKDPLGHFAPRFKAVAKYAMDDLVHEKGQKLDVELAFLFTEYNKDPSHEPGGLITAARIYPTLTFKVADTTHDRKAPSYRAATAVQILYRLNIRLDDRGIGNQCGVFTDLENIGPRGAAESMAATGGKPGSFTFLAAEKPVAFDLVGRGIDHGTMGGWDHTIQGWDNIHQYSHPAPLASSPDAGLESQPFTPGLPYGAHIHWRWGAEAATGATGIPGGPQYAGAQGPGTPLIDSQIPNQNLEFAISNLDGWFGTEEAKFLARIDQAPPTYLFRDFSDVWQDVHPVPDTLLPSGNIVIWMSFTVWGPAWYVPGIDYREAPSTPSHTVRYYVPGWGGTVFPQGIFFPHLPNAYFPGRGKLRAIPGVDKAQYLPRPPKRAWRR